MQQTTVQAPPAPGFPSPDVAAAPRAAYEAALARREAIADQLRELRDRRHDVASELTDHPTASGANRAGLEAQVANLDARILGAEQQLAQAEQQVSAQAGIPGVVQRRDPEDVRSGPPEEMFIVVPVVFTVFVLFPLVVTWAVRTLRRGQAPKALDASPAVQERLSRIEQAVDAIAVEVERVSEGQRFLTKVFADGGARAIGQGAAQAVELPVPDAAVRR